MTTFDRLSLCILIVSTTAAPAFADLFNLGAASGFAVLSGAQLTNSATAFTTNGLVGGVVSVTGFSPSVVATASATTAANTAFNSAYSQALTATASATAVAALANPITPGDYQVSGGYTLPSTLTFNGAGEYIIRINGSLSDNNTVFVLENGATANDILFLATGADVENASSTFEGTIFVGGSATVRAPGDISGGIFAKGDIAIQDLHPGSGTAVIDTPSAASAVPEPTSVLLLLTIAGLVSFTARRRLLARSSAR
jgi:hypothetical protein